MSDLFTDGTDFIDQAVPLDAAHPLHALRRERVRIVDATQASQLAMFGDAVSGLTRRERLAVAWHVCRLSQAQGLAGLYEQSLFADGAEPGWIASLAHSPESRLRTLLDFAATLMLRPIEGDRAAIESLQAGSRIAPGALRVRSRWLCLSPSVSRF
jgi:uncharacterized protein YciW